MASFDEIRSRTCFDRVPEPVEMDHDKLNRLQAEVRELRAELELAKAELAKAIHWCATHWHDCHERKEVEQQGG